MALHIVVLAAGQGKRMHSSLPKVLHAVGGTPMLGRVLQVAASLKPQTIHVVIGHEGEKLRAAYPDLDLNWVVQTEQLGTGHALGQTLSHLPDEAAVLVLCADTPLIRAESLQALIDICTKPLNHSLALLLTHLNNPFGFGRILRSEQGEIRAIVEEKDANASERQINEIYSGICCTSSNNLKRWLPQLSCQNAQGEYYLTDIVALAHAEGRPLLDSHVKDAEELLGVNDRVQLERAERIWQHRLTQALMLSGVSLADARRVDIRGELSCGQDVSIDANTVFIGEVSIGEGSVIESNVVLNQVKIGKHCRILASSVLEGCSIGDHCTIGPFARLRPGTELAEHCKIGNFVEAKKAHMGPHSKASHLSYLGDVRMGRNVNIGAGTITCNYDGANKHQTTIEDGVHIGSDTQLIAPVLIGENATIGAGSTIRKNVPPNELTLTLSEQKTIYGWKRKSKDPKTH